MRRYDSGSFPGTSAPADLRGASCLPRVLRCAVALASLAAAAPALAHPTWTRVPTNAEIQEAATRYPLEIGNGECTRTGITKIHDPTLLPDRPAALYVYMTETCDWFNGVRDENNKIPEGAKLRRTYYVHWLSWDRMKEKFTFGPISGNAMQSDFDANRSVIHPIARAGFSTSEEAESALGQLMLARKQGGKGFMMGWAVGGGKPLCPEVDFHFSAERLRAAGFENEEDRLATRMQVDQEDLLKQFTDALSAYNEEYGVFPTRSNNVLGLIPAGSWLFAEGGVYEEHSRDFVFNRTYRGLKDDVIKRGTEPALRDAIVQYSADHENARLTPGDVFLLALRQRNGDAREALLLAHNTLRSLARAGDFGWTGIPPDTHFFDTYLAEIRLEENAGPWYHLFGTAFFEMQSRGEWAPWMIVGMAERVGEVARDNVVGPAIDKIAGTEIARGDADSYVSAVSTISNFAEQWGRESSMANRAPDPEKYCFNVWGARLGAMLHKSLTASKTAPPPEVFRDAWENFNWKGIKETPATLREWVAGWGIFSPVKLTMRSATDSLTFDPTNGDLAGTAPILVTPFREKDGTWAAWFQPLTKDQYALQFEAIGDGTMHFAKADHSTGEVAAWTLPVRRGDSFTGVAGPGTTTTPIVRPNGNRIVPAIGKLRAPASPSLISKVGALIGGGALLKQLRGGIVLDQTDRLLVSILGAVVVLIIFGLIARAKRRR